MFLVFAYDDEDPAGGAFDLRGHDTTLPKAVKYAMFLLQTSKHAHILNVETMKIVWEDYSGYADQSQAIEKEDKFVNRVVKKRSGRPQKILMSDEEFMKIVADHKTLTDVSRALGVNFNTIKKRVKRINGTPSQVVAEHFELAI